MALGRRRRSVCRGAAHQRQQAGQQDVDTPPHRRAPYSEETRGLGVETSRGLGLERFDQPRMCVWWQRGGVARQTPARSRCSPSPACDCLMPLAPPSLPCIESDGQGPSLRASTSPTPRPLRCVNNQSVPAACLLVPSAPCSARDGPGPHAGQQAADPVLLRQVGAGAVGGRGTEGQFLLRRRFLLLPWSARCLTAAPRRRRWRDTCATCLETGFFPPLAQLFQHMSLSPPSSNAPIPPAAPRRRRLQGTWPRFGTGSSWAGSSTAGSSASTTRCPSARRLVCSSGVGACPASGPRAAAASVSCCPAPAAAGSWTSQPILAVPCQVQPFIHLTALPHRSAPRRRRRDALSRHPAPAPALALRYRCRYQAHPGLLRQLAAVQGTEGMQAVTKELRDSGALRTLAAALGGSPALGAAGSPGRLPGGGFDDSMGGGGQPTARQLSIEVPMPLED